MRNFGRCARLLMSNFESKFVKDLEVGDQVMNSLGQGEEIIELSRGVMELYRIENISTNEYIVVSCDNILRLKEEIMTKYKTENYFNLPVVKFASLSLEVRCMIFSYKKLPEVQDTLTCDPYELGISMAKAELASRDRDIPRSTSDNNLEILSKQNYLLNDFDSEGINARVINNSINFKAKLLSGILDTIGYYNDENYIIIAQEGITDIVHEIANHLDIQLSSFRSYIKFENDTMVKYTKIKLSGESLAFLCCKKLPNATPNKNLNYEKIFPFRVRSIGEHKCYGFRTKNDDIGLLSEDYFVV